MAPRRTVCTHITSIITNSSTSDGALAAAGSTHARGTLTLPTRDQGQAAAWLLAPLAGQYLSIAAEKHDPEVAAYLAAISGKTPRK